MSYYSEIGLFGFPTSASSPATTTRKSQDVSLNVGADTAAYKTQVATAQAAQATAAQAVEASGKLKTVVLVGGLAAAAGVGFYFWKKRKKS
jgi:LPXTG-motif cell wall-anchored protein